MYIYCMFILNNCRYTLRPTSSWIWFGSWAAGSCSSFNRLLPHSDGTEWSHLWRNELPGFNESQLR